MPRPFQPTLPFHHFLFSAFALLVSPAICQYFSILFPSSLPLSLVPSAGSIAGDRFVKLLIFFLALRPRSCHPDRAPLYPRILAFIPDVVEKYQPRCVTRLLLSLLLLSPFLFRSRWIDSRNGRQSSASSSCLEVCRDARTGRRCFCFSISNSL